MPKDNKYLKLSHKNVILCSLAIASLSFLAGYATLKLKMKLSPEISSKTETSKNIFTVKKNGKPELKFFVMSFCPFGNQMEDLLRPVFDLLGKQANIKPQYIFDKIDGNLADFCKKSGPDATQCETYVKNSQGQLKNIADCQQKIADINKKCNDEKNYLKIGNNFYTSLHGRVEANQDVREICAWNLSDDKKNWWNFVANVNKNCTAQNADTCWEEQAKQAGLDSNKITECFNKDAASLIDKEIAETEKFKISGSPSLLVNDVNFPPENAYTQDGTGTLIINKKIIQENKFRTSNTIKEAICAAFNKTPKECKTIIPEASAKTTNPSGGCGN